MKYCVPLLAELIVKVSGARKLFDYPKEDFYDWMNKTYRQRLDEYLETGPEKTPASSAVIYTTSRCVDISQRFAKS